MARWRILGGLAILGLSATGYAGLYAPLENELNGSAASFPEDVVYAGSACAGGPHVGFSAVDVTPGVKQLDGSYDLWMEEYVDANGNGVYDAPDPLDPSAAADPFIDANANGKWDGPYMAGYGHEKANNEYYVAESVHDPVWARAIALTCNDVTVGLVSVDTVGLFRGFVLDVRDEVPADFDHVAIASTHTHDSVDTMGLWGGSLVTDGKDPRTMAHYKQGILEALEAALDSRTQATSVRVGSALTRDLIPVAGTVQTDLRDPFVIDDRVVATQFLNSNGDTIGTIVNWSPHPETLAGTRSEISSDYADKLRRAIETEGATVGGVTKGPLGGTAVFFSGAVGGMMTTLGARPLDEAGQPVPDHSYAKAERIGEVVAFAAMNALSGGETFVIDGLRVQSRLVTVPADNPFLLALNTIGIFDHEVALGPVLLPAIGEPGVVAPIPFFRLELNAVTLASSAAGGGAEAADILQMVTVPGELLPEVALGNPLRHDAEASIATCYEFLPDKLLFNDAREAKVNPATGVREPGFARVVAAKPAYPKEPAIMDHASGRYVMLFGLGNDELGYIVPADDYELATMFPDVYDHGRDRCGDNDHYEETNSASSYLAPAVANTLASMLDPTFVPEPFPTELAGFLGPDGQPQPIPGWDSRGVWIDTSRSGGYESQEDTHVIVNVPSGLPGCWGFLNGHGQDLGQEPHEEMRGLWIDIDGGCEPGPEDALLFVDMWAMSEGQPFWRP